MSKHRDNAAAIIAEIAKASGLQFARPDRMTRAEAERVIAWAQSSKEVMAAYSDRSHPYHQEVQAFSQWPFYFAYDHPQDETGNPLDWDQVRTDDDDEAATEAEPEVGDFNQLTPGQAAARIESAYHDPKYEEWRIAIRDRSHADHDLARREMARLLEISEPAL